MKTLTVIHILLFILLLFLYQFTQAQDYLINTRGDTLYGQIKPLSFGKTEKKVQIISADKKRSLIPIFQVRSFVYKGDVFHPVKGTNGYTFMKLIKPGYLSLYAFQLENQVTYDGQYLAKRDGTGIEIPNLSFKKIMSRYLSDCEDVSSMIDEGQLNKKDLELIVELYNKCVETRTVRQGKEIAQNKKINAAMSSWDALEEKIKEKPEFEGKANALEMVAEIKTKISRGEKVPNFLLEGLKNSLAQAELTADLETALREFN